MPRDTEFSHSRERELPVSEKYKKPSKAILVWRLGDCRIAEYTKLV